jgi:hypothetical protein
VSVAPASVSVAPRAAMRVLVPLFATTLFVSSFLMFAVEPMAARRMLPVLGGVPMVWNGCVVFFQFVLLLGYGGAHALTRWVPSPARLLLYAGLAVLPLAFLRFGVDAAGAATATNAPLAWLLMSLLTSVGPAFLVLAVSASVLQGSLASSNHESARDPYFLYMASNAGSLVALVAYPTVIEPWLGLDQQAHTWTIGYGVFAVLILACAAVLRLAPSGAGAVSAATAAPVDAAEPITWTRRLRWIALSFAPSSLMLAVTTTLTTDIAPIPLLWVLPLSIYLLTFILAFGRGRDRATRLADRVLPSLLLGLSGILLTRATLPLLPGLVLHLLPFFAAAMFCHGLLARDRPAPQHLTEFYFWLAFGGMVGGLFNTLAAPLLFSRLLEYPLALTLVALLRPADPTRGPRQAIDYVLPVVAVGFVTALLLVPSLLSRVEVMLPGLLTCAFLGLARRSQPLTLGAVAGAFLIASPWMQSSNEKVLETERTFFGVYRVGEDLASTRRSLAHGTTLHGMQSLDPAMSREPLTYYHRTGPFGHMIDAVPQLREPGRVAAIGLGVGTLAAYARPGQQWTFYEIDPAIERIARDPRYFSFLEPCGSACQVVLGDARLSVAADTGPRFQLIVLDAFSSDAIPVHLLTDEAMRVYLSRLAPNGVLAFHVSNRHLALDRIVGRLAAAHGLVALREHDVPGTDKAEWPKHKTGSDWVVMARDARALGALTQSAAWHAPAVPASTPLWTDDFSNILGVLHIGGR